MKRMIIPALLFMLLSFFVSGYDCGNGECESYGGYGETHASCPQDCYCGDNDCHFDESITSCPADCYCGDGKCETAERHSGCTSDCPPMCGNGIIELGEVCDDGPLNSDVAPDACRTDCRDAYCTDGVIDTGEICDDGYHGMDVPTLCRDDCTLPYCGDGVVDFGKPNYYSQYEYFEECDDANSDNNDGCTDECKGCTALQDDFRITGDYSAHFCDIDFPDAGDEGIIIIEGFGITVDCQGATITGDGTGTGLVIIGDANIVKNCNVENFATGIRIEGGANMLMECNICNNDVDIDADRFTNYGDENTCDVAPNWFERVQGCSYECDGKKNRYFMHTIRQECVDKGLPVYEEMAPQMAPTQGLLGRILSFFGIGKDKAPEVELPAQEETAVNIPEPEVKEPDTEKQPVPIKPELVGSPIKPIQPPVEVYDVCCDIHSDYYELTNIECQKRSGYETDGSYCEDTVEVYDVCCEIKGKDGYTYTETDNVDCESRSGHEMHESYCEEDAQEENICCKVMSTALTRAPAPNYYSLTSAECKAKQGEEVSDKYCSSLT